MTEGQRDYLADLAGRKGIRLDNTDNVSAAWASAKIEELKAMPDANFMTNTTVIDSGIERRILAINREVAKWTFQA